MRSLQGIPDKIYTSDALLRRCNILRMQGKKIVFTNGVFDILHKGHIASLTEAASHGDFLVVAVNADLSVKKLKGPTRPVNDEQSRMLILASLLQTDAVILFEEDTPLELIKKLLPDVLVKGGDYTVDTIAGAKEVIANGGGVIIAGMIEGISTTGLIDKMK
ncbi:MAG: D-glycero-beta-D-manno-heptose 1-phosphate adenylyltransferase [Ferruginibacter sp.]